MKRYDLLNKKGEVVLKNCTLKQAALEIINDGCKYLVEKCKKTGDFLLFRKGVLTNNRKDFVYYCSSASSLKKAEEEIYDNLFKDHSVYNKQKIFKLKELIKA